MLDFRLTQTIAVCRAINSRLAPSKNCGPTSAPKMRVRMTGSAGRPREKDLPSPLLMERGPRPIEQMCVAPQKHSGRDWLGREDSNLENPPQRCGMEFPDPERAGLTYLLLGNCATGTPAE